MTEIDLGPCCICEGRVDVRTMISLDGKCPIPGRGWGCLKCHLPADGAVAVICDQCEKRYRQGQIRALRFICTGYPALDGRTPRGEMRGSHQHDLSYHGDELEVPD